MPTAVVFEEPEVLSVRPVTLVEPAETDVLVDVLWTGISTGTERLLFTGRMPPFPGLGYPLVPGYETVGRVRDAGAASARTPGEFVFVAGSRGFADARGLFGGAASQLVVPGAKAWPLAEPLGEQGVLLALAATALHAVVDGGGRFPDLVVGHGALGRLIARIARVLDPSHDVTVWEVNEARMSGADGYRVVRPDDDPRRDYRTICDVSGDARLVDSLVERLAPGGELVLAGFYHDPISFRFPPAFLRELRVRVAAEWKEQDLRATAELANSGKLSLDGLITHRGRVTDAAAAYATAFGDPTCVKMVLDWRPDA